MRTVCAQSVSKASLAVPRRLTTTPAALWSSDQRVRRHRGCTDNQPRHGHRCLAPEPARRPELASWNGPETRAGAGLSRYTRPPPPWAGSSIGTTSPGGAQSRRSSRVASRNPSRPRTPGAVYPSSNSPKREPSKEKYREPLAVLAVGRLRSRHWRFSDRLGGGELQRGATSSARPHPARARNTAHSRAPCSGATGRTEPHRRARPRHGAGRPTAPGR
jgi:hypothetical protein